MSEPDLWSAALACAVVAGDVTASGIARYARIHAAEAESVLAAARAAGVLDPDGGVPEVERGRLLGRLGSERVAEIHLAAARHWFAAGPDHLTTALGHARAAGTLMPLEELVAMADQGGRLSLGLGDPDTARDLLTLAADFDTSADHRAMALRLLDLARAFDLVGDVAGAREQLTRAAALAELVGDGHLVARAAVAHAVPADWYAGDARTVSLLQRAEAMDLDADDRVAVMAARALAEIRIPLVPDAPFQVAWVTRPEIAQDLAETALRKSEACRDDVQLLAMIAWRSTHRAPEHLAQRRDLATTALDLAQQLREPAHQLQAAVWLAVDALESGDRPLYDRAVGVARWVAHSTRNPRLEWQALTLAAGAAFLDGEEAAAAGLSAAAEVTGRGIDHPGAHGAALLFLGQGLATRLDPDECRTITRDDDNPALANAQGRAVYALFLAGLGASDDALRHARIAFRQLDPEASYLLLATRLAAVAEAVGDTHLAEDLIAVLSPWADHVAVDSNAWWCDGPVDLWLAALHLTLGDPEAARHHLERGEPVARVLDDVRSLARAERLRAALATEAPQLVDVDLTARERDVLRLIMAGYTNPQIATRLSFSLSTIRNDTTVIYRKLGVASRAAAVTEAFARGFVTDARPTG